MPSCDGLDDNLAGQDGIYQNWTEFALPKDYHAKVMFTDGQPFDPCKKYKENTQGYDDGTNCHRGNFDQTISEVILF